MIKTPVVSDTSKTKTENHDKQNDAAETVQKSTNNTTNQEKVENSSSKSAGKLSSEEKPETIQKETKSEITDSSNGPAKSDNVVKEEKPGDPQPINVA